TAIAVVIVIIVVIIPILIVLIFRFSLGFIAFINTVILRKAEVHPVYCPGLRFYQLRNIHRIGVPLLQASLGGKINLFGGHHLAHPVQFIFSTIIIGL